jgi:hypothetical protein
MNSGTQRSALSHLSEIRRATPLRSPGKCMGVGPGWQTGGPAERPKGRRRRCGPGYSLRAGGRRFRPLVKLGWRALNIRVPLQSRRPWRFTADCIRPPSSSGLGYQVLILETGVRLPVGVFRTSPSGGNVRGVYFCANRGAADGCSRLCSRGTPSLFRAGLVFVGMLGTALRKKGRSPRAIRWARQQEA